LEVIATTPPQDGIHIVPEGGLVGKYLASLKSVIV
jgi:hypothetical protein